MEYKYWKDKEGNIFYDADKKEFIANKLKELEATFDLIRENSESLPEGCAIGWDGFLTKPVFLADNGLSGKIKDMVEAKAGPLVTGANGPGNRWRS